MVTKARSSQALFAEITIASMLALNGIAAEHIIMQDSPARNWEQDCLPIGNGRLGCMIYGGIEKEHIQFNEDTVWIGDEGDTGAYQPLGDLFIELDKPTTEVGNNHSNKKSETGAYRRELDIDRAVHTITYERDGVKYQREYFASNPADVMVFRLTADLKKSYSGTIFIKDAQNSEVQADGNKLMFSGTMSGKYRDKKSNYAIRLQYEAQAMVMHEGGTLKVADGKITFKDCNSLLILLDGGTDYLNQHDKGWKQEHPHQRINARLAKAAENSYDELLKAHVMDYQELFNRVTLNLGSTPESQKKLSMPERLDAYRGTKALVRNKKFTYEADSLNLPYGKSDPELEEFLFQFARYLMISCSRPGCLPANLQGLWNNNNKPPWRCDYHSDVNIQMNYWFVDQANLSECFTPLSEWLYSVVPVKREATKKKYGVRGWAHRSENGIFGGASYKWIPGDAAWIMQNIWDHYAFTLDKQYLETRAYPLLKELCEFWEDFLIERPDRKLVSPESVSPEHGPKAEGNSYEQQLVYDLFTNYIEASLVLGKDDAFRKKIKSLRSRLLGPKIGKWGQLQEWAEDIDDPNDRHRHLSNLIAVHPGRQISPLMTPKLAEAARVSLDARGDGATGWSKAWKIIMWARLSDGNRAYKLLRETINGNISGNLLAVHPPYQIDCNFGYAAGVCEILIQSQTGIVNLLPSLPDEWPTGNVKGLKARGDFEVDMAWKDGKLTDVQIKSIKGSPLTLAYGDIQKKIETKSGKTYAFNGALKQTKE